MSKYSMDMNNEQRPKIKKLLDAGWRKFKIISGREQISKQRNEMIVLEVEDVKTGYREDWYCVSVKGRRWFLKSILSACGISAGQDGVYEWYMHDIYDKEVAGLVVHEPNEYINRDGNTVKTTQHRVQEVKKVDDVLEWNGE